jgi:hypothetical protein
VILLLLLAAWLPASLQTVLAQTWQVGQDVDLTKGTCIRVGPGVGFRAHTKVPVDNWRVRVINGPRVADGHTWYDTSRAAAGDPSGGTGWVAADQADTDCPWPTTGVPPGSADALPDNIRQVLENLRTW